MTNHHSVRPIVLFRTALSSEDELRSARRFFEVVHNRADILPGALIIPRYSALPFFNELDYDCRARGAKLINSPAQFNWIANFDYYEELKRFTPTTWTDHDFYTAPDGRFVVKGRTNSRKHQWNKLCFADSKKRALEIASELANDPLIGPQGIIYRRFVPLKTFEIDPIYGCPISNEWRLFYYKDRLLASGYYWSNAEDTSLGVLTDEGLQLADAIAKIASQHNNFFAMDIAETEAGGWTLIELNSGEMAGVSCVSSDLLYSALSRVISAESRPTVFHIGSRPCS